MKYAEKQNLYEYFLLEWGTKLAEIPHVLNYLASYPELTSKLQNFLPLKPEQLHESQLEWVALVSQLTNPFEAKFFKSYWVPLQHDDYQYFIDLSSDTLPIFEFHYIFFEPFGWYKTYFFKNITSFMASVDDPSIDLDAELEANSAESWIEIEWYLDENERLRKEGKLTVKQWGIDPNQT